MTEQEFRKRTANILIRYAYAFEVDDRYDTKPYVEEVLALVKKAGWVKLSDNQTLPKSFWHVVRNYPSEISNELSAIGWRRIEQNAEWENQYARFCALDEK